MIWQSMTFNSQKWRPLFDQFDNEGFGEIPVEDFIIALTSPEFQTQVPSDKIEILYHHAARLKEDFGVRAVSIQDFLDVVSEYITLFLHLCAIKK